MIKGFEDAFMDKQSDYISLCLEFVKNDVDVVYGWIYQTPGMITFGAFFKKNGNIVEMEDLVSDEMIDSFYDVGYGDVKKIYDVCKEYEHKCPNMIKMIYDVKTKKYDANYTYFDDKQIEEINPDNLFDELVDEESNK